MARMRCRTSSGSTVESTAWPASYRTAIFAITRRIVLSRGVVTEVPKVTVFSGGHESIVVASRLGFVSGYGFRAVPYRTADVGRLQALQLLSRCQPSG